MLTDVCTKLRNRQSDGYSSLHLKAHLPFNKRSRLSFTTKRLTTGHNGRPELWSNCSVRFTTAVWGAPLVVGETQLTPVQIQPPAAAVRRTNADQHAAGNRPASLNDAITLLSPVVTLCSANFTLNNSTFCPHTVFVCFVWIWEQTVITSLYNINWLVFITERECVYCAVRTGYLCVLCGSENKQRLLPYKTNTH
jgi:hypothetical protein